MSNKNKNKRKRLDTPIVNFLFRKAVSSKFQRKKSHRKGLKLLENMAQGFLMHVLIWIRIQFDILVDFLASLYWDPKKEIIPPLDKQSKILLESATSLASKIRKKELKSETLVKLCIERIKMVNPIINAMTDERFDAAILEAQQIDLKIEMGLSEDAFKKTPFLGVPFTAKESYAAAGMLHTLGIMSRMKCRAEEDAEAIKLMKDAGAILIAVSNVPELNKWQETRNMVFGQTCNPYHTGCIVGGSSGGEAALVSSVCSPIGICSDIGGSTRMPAYYCGLFGHCPTAETTNMRGGTLRTGLEKNSMVSAGSISKHCDDIIPILKILTNEKASLLKLDSPVDLKKLKYYYVNTTDDMRCSAIQMAVKECFDKVLENLNETVASQNPPVKIQLEGFKYMYKLWRYWMSKEDADFPLLMGNMKTRPYGIVELLKKLVGRSEYTFAGIIGLLDSQILPREKDSWALPIYEKLKNELLEILGNDGVLLFYSCPQTAPYHYTPLLRPYNFAYWCIFNALKFPATQVPLGLDDDGLPLGIQVVSAPYNDRLCIAVAKHLEENFNGFVPPCNIIS